MANTNTGTKLIDKSLLIRVFKDFKRNPKKVFVARDFFINAPNIYRRKYLNTLISLNLIEEVIAVYNCGVKNSVRRQVKGYRLKNNV